MQRESVSKRNALVDKLVKKIKHDYDTTFDSYCKMLKEADMCNPDTMYNISIINIVLNWTNDIILYDNGMIFKGMYHAYDANVTTYADFMVSAKELNVLLKDDVNFIDRVISILWTIVRGGTVTEHMRVLNEINDANIGELLVSSVELAFIK